MKINTIFLKIFTIWPFKKFANCCSKPSEKFFPNSHNMPGLFSICPFRTAYLGNSNRIHVAGKN